MKKIEDYKIEPHFSIREAVTKMDKGGLGFCVCVDDKDRVVGVITDGDFRHAVYSGIKLDENVSLIINRDFYKVQTNYENRLLKDIFDKTIVKHVPVLHGDKLHDIITEEDFCRKEKGIKKQRMENPVVIMAGGKGGRLNPFTRILPKPLIPFGNEAVIKVIMDEFAKFGMDTFIISLNDKGRMIKAYFFDHDLGYHIEYIEETKPLGTAGALKYLEGRMDTSFFVSNCDVIIHTDYDYILEFHRQGSFPLTIVGSMQKHIIPYGVCEIEKSGRLKTIKEKPQFDFLINTGLYLLEPTVLKYIPKNKSSDMTDLIADIQASGQEVGVFPVSEKSWIDVGQWNEYRTAIKEMGI